MFTHLEKSLPIFCIHLGNAHRVGRAEIEAKVEGSKPYLTRNKGISPTVSKGRRAVCSKVGSRVLCHGDMKVSTALSI